MRKPIRRIVTGHDEKGRSIIVFDGPAPGAQPGRIPGQVDALLWRTQSAPARNSGNDDAAPAGLKLSIPPQDRGGTVFRMVDFPPESSFDPSDLGVAESGFETPGNEPKRHWGFHRTRTLDYVIVVEGEIWALLDEGEILIRAGDVLVQRGTVHAWANRSADYCRLAVVLVDAEPLP